MTVTRHLAAVPAIDGRAAAQDACATAQAASESAERAFRAMVRYAVGIPLDEQIPQAVLDWLHDLDDQADAAGDLYDIRTRELDGARDALAEAQAALAAAEDEWQETGAAMNDSAVAASQARWGAGVLLTANGYVRAVQS
jgi:hypothetical protein